MSIAALAVALLAALAAVAAAAYARDQRTAARNANDLLGRQLADQIRSNEFDRAAHLAGAADDPIHSVTPTEAHGIYKIEVANVGRGPADSCTVWLEMPSPGAGEPGSRIGPLFDLGTLGAGERRRLVPTIRTMGGGVRREGVIAGEWTDANGHVDRRVIGSVILLL